MMKGKSQNAGNQLVELVLPKMLQKCQLFNVNLLHMWSQ